MDLLDSFMIVECISYGSMRKSMRILCRAVTACCTIHHVVFCCFFFFSSSGNSCIRMPRSVVFFFTVTAQKGFIGYLPARDYFIFAVVIVGVVVYWY